MSDTPPSTTGCVLTLAHLAPGKRARVTCIHGRGPIYQRLLDFGVMRGVEIEVQCVAPLRDPIKIKVRGAAISLRRKEADMIEVVEVAEGAA